MRDSDMEKSTDIMKSDTFLSQFSKTLIFYEFHVSLCRSLIALVGKRDLARFLL